MGAGLSDAVQRAASPSQIIAAWTGDRPLSARQILAENPSLARCRSLVIDLAYEEFCQRLDRGEPVDPAEFAASFPNVQASLLRLIGIHRRLEQAAQSRPASWPEAGDVWLGFRLIEYLGRGAFSRVFLARELALGQRLVVIKATQLGVNEARMLGPLQHPHIVQVHSVTHDAARGLTAVCLPFLGRATLYDVLDDAFSRGGSPRAAQAILRAVRAKSSPTDPPAQAMTSRVWPRSWTYVDGLLELIEHLASALAFTHAQGVLHLDIKPSNILVTAEGRALLFDFNLSAATGGSSRLCGGTLPYMAPEQLGRWIDPLQPCVVDGRTDLFSLAVTIYELLCGRLPFGSLPNHLPSDRIAEHLVERQRRGPAPLRSFNPFVDRKLASLIEQCLAFDPDRRIASVSEFLERVRRNRRPLRRAARWVLAHRRWIPLAATVLLAASAAGGWSLATRESYPVREYRLGATAFDEQDYKAAVEHLGQVLNVEPSNDVARLLRCRALMESGDPSTALIEAIRLLGTSQKGRASALVGYLSATEHNDWNSAEAHFRMAIDQGFGNAAVHNNLGYCLMKLGRDADAESCFRDALAWTEDFPPALHNLARLELPGVLAAGRSPDITRIESALRHNRSSLGLERDAALLLAAAASRHPDLSRRSALQAECLAAASRAVDLGLSRKALHEIEYLSPQIGSESDFRRLVERAPLAETGQSATAHPLLVDPFGESAKVLSQ